MSSPINREVPLKVFLVDDNEDTRRLMELVLQATGYEVHTAGTMRAALREFPLYSSEVLLSDIGLPDGDGWQLLRELQKSGLFPYAVAMSGFGTKADFDASAEAGFRHHLVKPIELSAIERVLEEACLEVGMH